MPGIFRRIAHVKLRKPGKLGWKDWQKIAFEGVQTGENRFVLSLASLPRGETDLRLEIAHGDNSPIEFSAVRALYQAPDLFFQATTGGDYLLYGGNAAVGAPAYDMALVRDQLLKKEPQKVVMGETAAHSQTAIKKTLEHAFSDHGWGLYVVLGLITLVLIVVIIKIFPEEEAGEAEQPAAAAKTDEPTKDGEASETGEAAKGAGTPQADKAATTDEAEKPDAAPTTDAAPEARETGEGSEPTAADTTAVTDETSQTDETAEADDASENVPQEASDAPATSGPTPEPPVTDPAPQKKGKARKTKKKKP